MSYPGVDPSDTQQTNPVGTQERTEGDFKTSPGEQQVIDKQALKEAVREVAADIFAPTSAWSQNSTINFVVECPSGQRALVKHLNTMDLINADLIEEVDIFTRMLFPVALDPTGAPVEIDEAAVNKSFWENLKDPDKKLRFFRLLNALLELSVVKPRVIDDGVALVEENGKTVVKFGTNNVTLGPGEVASSAIDFADKMHIYGMLNQPLESIKPFREGSQENVPAVSEVERVGSSAE